MTDVAAWLRGLGLGRYEATFRDNDVGADVLPELTAEDLREIGVAVVLRPRLGGLPDDAPVLRREDVPALFALVDEVAETAGTRGVDRIAVDGESNASVFSYGLLGRRVLTIGLPLWTSAMRRARLVHPR